MMCDHCDCSEIAPEMKREIIDEREPETVCNGVEMYLVMIGHRANYSCDLVKTPLIRNFFQNVVRVKLTLNSEFT